MITGRILIVEDDQDISKMLRIYFESQGYEVLVSGRGGEALDVARKRLPNVVVLDIQLPDIDGYEVCRQLRSNLRTSHIPIIFLTQKDERSDRIAGLELGADDYITKPFDIEELRLRIQNAMKRAHDTSLTDPTTGLPSGKLIEEQLKRLMSKPTWAILYIGINAIDVFNNVYGFIAKDDVLRFVGLVMSEAIDELGTAQDFIGHIGGDDFIIVTSLEAVNAIKEHLEIRFTEEVVSFYDFKTREQGFVSYVNSEGKGSQAPLMSLNVGKVSSADGPFTDIRQITEVAAEARRQAQGNTRVQMAKVK
jgi:PleD family two-component response regulator